MTLQAERGSTGRDQQMQVQVKQEAREEFGKGN